MGTDRLEWNLATAVVGCGYWGQNLVRQFYQLSDLKLCCDRNPEVRGGMRRRFPGVSTTDDYQEVLKREDIDAIAVATPAQLHAEMAMAALDAGKHVLVEKPLALSVEEAEAIERRQNETNLCVAVGHLLEYHPGVEYLHSLIHGQEIGDVYYCYSQRVNLGRIRADENALWSLAPHDISVLLYLLGETPVRIAASGKSFLRDGVEDIVFLTLEFSSGVLAHVHASWLDPHKERKLTVVGEEKMLVFDDMETREKVRVYDKGVERKTGIGATRPDDPVIEHLTVRKGDVFIPYISNEEPLKRECSAFLDAVANGSELRNDVRDGVAVVRVLTEAERALCRGRTVTA